MGMYDNYDPEMQKQAGMIGFIFMLIVCLIFVAAKVFGFITWSWLWVFCPVWGPMALGLVLLILGVRPPQ